MAEVLTIVLKGDGSGLTGTLKTASGEVRAFSGQLDVAGKGATDLGRKVGDAAKDAGNAIRNGIGGNAAAATEDLAKLATRGVASFGAIGAAVTVAVAALATFAVAQVKGYKEQQELNRSILLTGNYAGTTAGRMADLRNEIGATIGEYGKAGKAVNELARSGAIASDSLGSATRAAVNLAMLSGDSIESITAKMSRNADEPAKLMRALDDEYHFLTASVYEQVTALEKQGQEQDALALGFDALEKASRERVQQMVEQAGWMETAWNKVKGAVVGAWQAMKDVGREDAEYRYKTESVNYEAMQKSFGVGYRGQSAGELKILEEQRARMLAAYKDLNDARVKALHEAQTATTQAAGVSAIDAINKTLDAGRTKAQQYDDAIKSLKKEFASLRSANPDSDLLKGVVFGADGSISGGAYDRAAAGLKEKYRDKAGDRAAASAAAQAAREAQRADDLRLRTLSQLNDMLDKQSALYTGPVEKANASYAITVRDLDEKERKLADAHRLDAEMQAKLQAARAAAADAHERDLALAEREQEELDRRKDLVGALLTDYARESAAVGMTGRQREIHTALLNAEREALQLYNDGLRESIALTGQEREAIISGIGAMYDRAEAVDRWLAVGMQGIGDFRDLLADAFSGGLDDADDFFDELKDIFRRGWRDALRTFLDQKMVQPLQQGLSNLLNNAFSGQGSSGGGVMDWLTGLFKGNGFSAGGQSGSGFSSAISTAGKWFSSLFGGGASAGAGGVTPFASSLASGSSWSQLGGMFGGGASSGAAGATGAGAGGMASAIPVIGWIYAGMQLDKQLYDQGWRLNGSDYDWRAAAMSPFPDVAVGGALTDKLLQNLGVSAKTASIITGSSTLAKLFGRGAPKITGQGITGSYGFSGLEGQTYADIKQKGGLFRSDKKWTQYGAIDSSIDDAFDAAAQSVRVGALKLADQAGMDISAQLANVKVNLGKFTLDADPEKAQEQLEQLANDMVEALSKKAVQALGFNRLLDDGFAATEIMGALSSAMTLVTGEAGKLERSLSGLEVENIQRAVEYFEQLATTNGTTLTEEIQRVTGTLNDYAGLMTDVQSQLLTNGLSEYQQAALQIETTYRNQVKSANDLAKSLGLSGARAEDLAKIEQLRAVSMANLQQQMEAERDNILNGLAISDYSPATDREKLAEALQQLRDAAASGDTSAVASLSQSALGLGRNLYASGTDYNDLYNQVTSIIGDMGVPSLVSDDGTSMGDLADILLDLPQQIASSMFELLYNPATTVNIPATTPGTIDGEIGQGLRDIRDRLDLLISTGKLSLTQTELSRLAASMNA